MTRFFFPTTNDAFDRSVRFLSISRLFHLKNLFSKNFTMGKFFENLENHLKTLVNQILENSLLKVRRKHLFSKCYFINWNFERIELVVNLYTVFSRIKWNKWWNAIESVEWNTSIFISRSNGFQCSMIYAFVLWMNEKWWNQSVL